MNNNLSVSLLSCANATTGIGRYVRELHAYYLKMGVRSELITRDKSNLPHSKNYFFPAPKSFRNSLGPFFLKLAIQSKKAHVFHADYVDAGSILSTKSKRSTLCITTVHDGIPFKFPKSIQALHRYKRQLEDCSKVCDSLIVVSQSSKEDLLTFTNIDESKIKIIYNGINHDIFYPNSEQVSNSIFTIRYHGGLSSGHKNTSTLLKICQILEEKKLDFRLEIAGANPYSTPFPNMAKKMGLKRISFVGFVPDSTIQSFLATADAYIYPSKYEGFGFPPLEAMACGVPVVSSSGGSLQEILGNAALTCEPNAEALAEQLIKLYFNSDLATSLRIKGIEKAQSFTWKKCALETLRLYHM